MSHIVEIWSSRSCIVLDIELADKKFIYLFEFAFMGMFRDTHFALQKSTNPQSKQFAVQETCMELCLPVEACITMSFPTFFLEMWRMNTLQKNRRMQGSCPFNG